LGPKPWVVAAFIVFTRMPVGIGFVLSLAEPNYPPLRIIENRVSKSEASPTLDEQLSLKTGRTMLLGALVILIPQHVQHDFC